MSQQLVIVRKVVFDNRSVLKVLNPCMQSRQSVWLEQFHPYHFLDGFKPGSQPSMYYVYQSYAVSPEKLLVSKALLFQCPQRFQ
ncbi:hypothetical protein RchiOBHm_Chr4g0396381 [Rosa chinensis]|uniref:Uncharacterized protein n=1 Tax=Rosa chinensis TaxID=74649 RepID=A0A2P6QRR2_ROSCH|nr:hypothetical protein RchiOBHm_Chr4g0396381 [Rosa chinensis]